MSLDIIAKPFLVSKGKGFVNFHDRFRKPVNFSINLLHNGKVRGELDFSIVHYELVGYILENKQFSFTGTDSDGYTISSKNCILSSINGKDCNFYPFDNLEELDLETFKKWRLSVNNTFTNRHVVEHGKYDDSLYSEENSIKLILLLDTIFYIISH